MLRSLLSTPIPAPLPALRGYLRDARAAAAIELALGAVVLIGISALCFDLYSRIKADTAAARVAVTMADYVSRDVAPDGGALTALGRFLHAHELRVPANLVFVITAFRRPDGDGAALERLWVDDTIRIGDATATGTLAEDCVRLTLNAEGDPALPADFTMAASEVVIVVEVCARLTREGSITGRFVAGDIYRVHALPFRDPDEVPAAPTRAETIAALGPRAPLLLALGGAQPRRPTLDSPPSTAPGAAGGGPVLRPRATTDSHQGSARA